MDGLMTVTNNDLMQAVRDTAVLANVSISVWSGVKTDKKLAQELKTRYGATGDPAKVVKNMLAGADASLKRVHSAFNAVRTYHYQMTLAWAVGQGQKRSGLGLLPNAFFQEYVVEMARLNEIATTTLNEFIAEYEREDGIIASAKHHLGGMADEYYPSADEIRGKFNISLDFQPIPDTSSFPGVPKDWEPRMQKILASRQTQMLNQAQEAMWTNAREQVEHMVERIRALQEDDNKAEGAPSTRFHASAVEHVRQLLKFLPGWNVSGDQRVDEIVKDINSMLDGVNADVIKDNAGVRDNTLSRAQSVMDKLNAWRV